MHDEFSINFLKMYVSHNSTCVYLAPQFDPENWNNILQIPNGVVSQ